MEKQLGKKEKKDLEENLSTDQRSHSTELSWQTASWKRTH